MKYNIKDYIGKQINYLTPIAEVSERAKDGSKQWLFKCQCGQFVKVAPARVISGHKQSCGCLQNADRHGVYKTKLYKCWSKMKTRCYNKQHDRYKNYGGRGITVCDEWLHDFQAFHDWAMANGYQEGLTIDRIDVNGNYEPANCRWATWREQSRNRTTNRLVTLHNETHCIVEWAEITGISQKVIANRIRANWPVEKALTTPVQKRLPHPKN